MNFQPSHQQFQMTPFYAQASSDDRTQYNADGYYNNYSFSPAQAPPHPDQQPWTQNNHHNNFNNHNGQVPAFASPPPPTWQQVHHEFGTTPTTNSAHSFDLLNGHDAPQPAYGATPPPATQPVGGRTHASGMDTSTYDNNIPLEIIESQQRAMEQAKQRQQQHQHNGNGSAGTGSRALATTSVRTLAVPRSNNPVGSDAVHPNRMQWKAARGSKTVVGATSGAIIGGLAFGPAFPVGMVLGGAVGGYATNKLSKQGERRAQRQWEQSSFQHGAKHSMTANTHNSMV